jgi:hypothetical protein
MESEHAAEQTVFELHFSRTEGRPPTLAEVEELLEYVRSEARAEGWDLLDPLPGSEEYRLVRRK